MQHLPLGHSIWRFHLRLRVFLLDFFWESFGALSPKPVEFRAVKPEKVIVDGEEKRSRHTVSPRLRWSSEKVIDKKALSRIINVEKNYNFQSYSYTSCGVTLCCSTRIRARKSWWCPRWTFLRHFWFLLAIVTPALLPSKLDTNESGAS